MLKVSAVLHTAQIDAKLTHLGRMYRFAAIDWWDTFFLSDRFYRLVDVIDGAVSGLRKNPGLDFPTQDYGEGICRVIAKTISKLGKELPDKNEIVEDLVQEFVAEYLRPDSQFIKTLTESSRDPYKSKTQVLGGGLFQRAEHFVIDKLFKSKEYQQKNTDRLNEKPETVGAQMDKSAEDSVDIGALPFVKEFRKYLQDASANATDKQKLVLGRILKRFNDYIAGNKENNDSTKQNDLKRMNELLSSFIQKNPKFKAFGESMDRHKVVVAAEYELRKATEKYWATVPNRTRAAYQDRVGQITSLYATLKSYRITDRKLANIAKKLVNQIVTSEQQLASAYDTIGGIKEIEAVKDARQRLLKVAPEYRPLLSSGGLSATGLWVTESTLDNAYSRRQFLRQTISKIDKVLAGQEYDDSEDLEDLAV